LRQKVALLDTEAGHQPLWKPERRRRKTIKIAAFSSPSSARSKRKWIRSDNPNSNDETVLIPITVQQYFVPVERIDPLYVQVRNPKDVESVTTEVQELLQSRHRVALPTKWKIWVRFWQQPKVSRWF